MRTNDILWVGGRRVRELFDGRNSEIFADLLREDVDDFCMAWNRGTFIQGWIMPPGVPSPFSKVHTPVIVQVAQQFLPFHMAIGSS